MPYREGCVSETLPVLRDGIGMRLLSPLFDVRAMTIDADPGQLQQARDWAMDVAVDARLPEPVCHQVKLAMSEAVANAIKYGSRDANDSIRIEAFRKNGSLVFEVRDSGGFAMAPPSAGAGFDDEGGRGLELLAVVMDEVRLTTVEGGTRLRFAKRLS